MPQMRIKCRYCDWSALPFRTLKNGTTRGPNRAYNFLFAHVEEEHPEFWEKIKPILKGIYEEEPEEEVAGEFFAAYGRVDSWTDV